MVTLRRGDSRTDMVTLQQLASRLWPTRHHPGGLAWALAIDELHQELHLAFEGPDLVGWAGRSTGSVEVTVDPATRDAAPQLLAWALEQEAGTPSISIPVFNGDEAVRAAVVAAGFELDGDADPVYGMFHDSIPVAPALVRARGGSEVSIHTGPPDDYPAPAATYAAIGFSTAARATLWKKRGVSTGQSPRGSLR